MLRYILKKRHIYGMAGMMFLFSLILSFYPIASAIESTAYTYTLAVDSYGYIRTQDAFMPGGTYLKDIGMNTPEDFYYKKGFLYIADSGNGRIIKYELDSGKWVIMGEGELRYPTGVAVGEDGRIYIADYQASELIVMSDEGVIEQRIGKPMEVFYGPSPYKPKKVDVDVYGNIYALSEGTHEGILQFNEKGVFNGFFGANKTKGLNLVEWFEKNFYTEEQKARLFFRTPPNIVSITVSENNLVYSVTQNDPRDAIKKLNLAGVNVLQRSGRLWGENNYVDTAVSADGFIFAVTDTGSIEEFDDTGVLMLLFGGRAASSDRNGLTAVVSAIEVDENYNIFILDKERALIQTYYPTDYANNLHRANILYNAGYYKDSLESWEEVLRLNPTAYMAHNGYAKTMFQLGEYKIAAEHYKLISDSDRYSDCFWEIRSAWLRNHMNVILILIAVLFLLRIIFKLINRNYRYTAYLTGQWENCKKNHKLLKHLCEDTLYMVRHPIDGHYYLKTGQHGSALAASILYITAFFVYIFNRISTSFVFGGGIGYWSNPIAVSFLAIIPVVLLVIGSYLISSINDGEGSIKNVYISIGYAFTVYILFMPLLTILSHLLTSKEMFLFKLSSLLVIGYTIVLIFLSVKETHCYTPKKTIANLLLTIFFMIIAMLAFIIIYILCKELLSFLAEVFEEVKYRAYS